MPDLTELASGTVHRSSRLTGEIARFGIAGLANVGVDLGVYLALLASGAPIWVAKAIAFGCGTVFAFVVNKKWTFKREGGGAGQFLAVATLYIGSMTLNVGINSLTIALISQNVTGKSIAYVAATLASATINFVGMKLIFLHWKPQATGD